LHLGLAASEVACILDPVKGCGRTRLLLLESLIAVDGRWVGGFGGGAWGVSGKGLGVCV
jgi:hypothetical protein